MKTMGILLTILFLASCGGEPVENPSEGILTEAAAISTQHWTEVGHGNPPPSCGAFADMPAAAPDCTSIPRVRQGSSGECSVGCFGQPGDIRVAVGCHGGCSSEYIVSFK